MSQPSPMVALLGAAKEAIQTLLGLSTTPNANGMVPADLTCDITPEGRPKPASGQMFYGLTGEGMTSQSTRDLDRDFEIKVVITLRAGYVPNDRTGNALLMTPKTTTPAPVPNTGGLWARVEELMDKTTGLHLSYTALSLTGGEEYPLPLSPYTGALRSYALPVTVNGFQQPLAFRRATYRGPVGPEWFWADAGDDKASGVVVEVDFGFARSVQRID